MPQDLDLAPLLASLKARQDLRRQIRDVKASVPWLVSQSRPDIAAWTCKSLLGAEVHRISGCSSDALGLAFSGKVERERGFLSLPQGHKANLFRPEPPPPSSEERSRAKIASQLSDRELQGDAACAADGVSTCCDRNDKFTATLDARVKVELKGLDLFFVAPPPDASTQIVKLRWVPSQSAQRKKAPR